MNAALRKYTNFEKEELDDISQAVRSVLFKLTKGEAPDISQMNAKVRKLLDSAIQSDGIEELLKAERNSFENAGIDYEEKAFYDILLAVSKKYEIEYPNDKMIELSKEIYKEVLEQAQNFKKYVR